MTGAPLPRRRLIQLGAAFVVLVAAAVAFGGRADKAPTAAAEIAPSPWTLPEVDGRDPARDAATLTARHPWGGGGAFRDIDSPRAPSTSLPWHLAGVIDRGDERLALILVGQGPAAKLEYRTIGDLLPDGSVLVQMSADSATSERGQPAAAERHVYRLFEKVN